MHSHTLHGSCGRILFPISQFLNRITAVVSKIKIILKGATPTSIQFTFSFVYSLYCDSTAISTAEILYGINKTVEDWISSS